MKPRCCSPSGASTRPACVIDRALAQNPRAGLAYALRAVIEVVQNDKATALADAKRGVELEPKATAPRIALSYAQQANFDLKGARDTLLQATATQPQDALAWARLGELWLMFGYRNRAREAAETAVQPRARPRTGAPRFRLYRTDGVPHQDGA